MEIFSFLGGLLENSRWCRSSWSVITRPSEPDTPGKYIHLTTAFIRHFIRHHEWNQTHLANINQSFHWLFAIYSSSPDTISGISCKYQLVTIKYFFTRSPSTESTSWKSVCLSVCLSSLQDFEYRPITSSQDHARPHIIYCWAEGDVSCHLAMSMTHTKTNTETKTNTKCFKDPMYAIFLNSRGFNDFK